eukprot:CAMPEP_0115109294 /NCGR_PEP_ID=MMETSP0227-20121206/38590_1 /TAXON_ID=89957 /ORGANISM="Polarella glacialis, Strain CCMP 1383" /LENGTH=83 /DNA_ID=CAMNT_0002507905 /DNA_START=335 /DNA_END=583 /DNA_ORIENTATION=+
MENTGHIGLGKRQGMSMQEKGPPLQDRFQVFQEERALHALLRMGPQKGQQQLDVFPDQLDHLRAAWIVVEVCKTLYQEKQEGA